MLSCIIQTNTPCSDVMKFEVEKRSWPSFSDQGSFEVHIDEPGFDLAIGIVVVQPGMALNPDLRGLGSAKL